MIKLSVCAIIKNEDKYLIEWLIYYKMIGVTKFYIYDNNSSDNSKNILKMLQKDFNINYKLWDSIEGISHNVLHTWIVFLKINGRKMIFSFLILTNSLSKEVKSYRIS